MRQILLRWTKSNRPNARFARIVASVGAEGILRNLRLQPNLLQSCINFLYKGFLFIEQPRREEPFTMDFIARMTFFRAGGIMHRCLEIRVFGCDFIQHLLNWRQYAFRCFPDQQPAIIRRPTMAWYHRSAGVRRRNDIRQHQYPLAQHRVRFIFHRSQSLNHRYHFFHRVHAFFRVGGMGRHAKRFDHDLCAATLANLEIQLRRFANDYQIRLHAFGNRARCHPFKAFFVYNARNNDFALKMAA